MMTGLRHVCGLRCVRCGATVAMSDIVYACGGCGGNLQIEYDYAAVRRAWSREQLRDDPDRSIWRYQPLYPVQTRIAAPPIGWTPLFRAETLGARLGLPNLFIKDDGRNPSASFKDRASAIALARARDLGRDLVTCASTGNAAASTAVLAAALGLRTRIFIPQTAPPAKVAQLLAFGADVLAVEGTYDQAFDLCLAATQRFGWYNRNTGYNPFTREGKKSVSFEICEQLGWQAPDVVVVPVGDGNIISGVWKGFSEFHRLGFIDRLPRLLAVQAEESDAVVRALEHDGVIAPVSGRTIADSISVSVPRDGEAAVQAVLDSGGWGVRVRDDEVLAAVLELARIAGVFAEPAAAAGLAGLKQAATRGLIPAHATVVLLVTGNGLKDVGAIAKVAGTPRRISADPERLNEVFGGDAPSPAPLPANDP
jgi:threonine synthase